jgi:hypothetical protein
MACRRRRICSSQSAGRAGPPAYPLASFSSTSPWQGGEPTGRPGRARAAKAARPSDAAVRQAGVMLELTRNRLVGS